MDRRTVDEDLDDLVLDGDLDTASGDPTSSDAEPGDSEPTGVMAPPKRSGTRKPPGRKNSDSSSGNGRRPGSGSAGSGAVGASDADTAVASDTSVVKDEADTAAAASAPADTVASEEVPGESDPAKEGAATPAMPADDIWTPRSRSASSGDPGWTSTAAGDRPRGNAFEMTDAFSAPPMPSDTAAASTPSFTAKSSTASSFGSTSTSSSGFAGGSAASPAGAGSTPPTQAFPRPGAPAKSAKSGKSANPRGPKVTARRPSSARQAHLTIARVEPWSVMKFSFAVSVVAFVVLFVAVAVLYGVLSALGVFNSLQHLVTTMTSSQGSAGYNARPWFSASRILSYTVLLGGINIVLITAMSTIGAVIYNLTSRLIGGVEVTLREAE